MISPASARLESFELVCAAALFAFLSLPIWRRRRVRDDAMTAMQAVVLRVEEDGRTRTVRAPVPITIGRAPSATLVILRIRDLDSRNGTLVNARPLDGAAALRDGDEIDVGTTRITFGGVGPWK